MTRKTGTMLAKTVGQDTCGCKFSIDEDAGGYFFCCGMGSAQHQYHVPVQNGAACMHTQFLDSVKRAILLSVAQANVSDGVARNLCYQRNKVVLLRGQIHSLHKMSQHVVTSDESMDHVDDFSEQFKKKKEVSFCCLYNYEEEDKTGQVKAQLINEMNDLAPEDTPIEEAVIVFAFPAPFTFGSTLITYFTEAQGTKEGNYHQVFSLAHSAEVKITCFA
jgi:hypothetical protein